MRSWLGTRPSSRVMAGMTMPSSQRDSQFTQFSQLHGCIITAYRVFVQSRCLLKHLRLNYKQCPKTRCPVLPLRSDVSAMKHYGTFQEETVICREQPWILYKMLLQSGIPQLFRDNCASDNKSQQLHLTHWMPFSSILLTKVFQTSLKKQTEVIYYKQTLGQLRAYSPPESLNWYHKGKII